MSETAFAESGTRLQNFLDRAGLRGFPWKTAIILYTISWGWLFIVRNSYWSDDWDTLKFPQLSVFDFKSLGLAPWTSVVGQLHSILGPGFLRILVFICFFTTGLTVFGISSQISTLALWQRKLGVLLFLLLPFNHIRVALMTFHYTSGILMFYLAWYLITAFKSKTIFCIGLVLFFLSFQMHSLLFLYLLPVTHFAFINQSNKSWHLRIKIELIALIAVPLTYVVLRYFFWPEKMRYHNLVTSSVSSTTLFIVVALGGTYLIFFRRFVFSSKIRVSPLMLMAVGLFCSLLALLPYLLAGFYEDRRVLPFQFMIDFVGRSEYRSRHLALQPLGFAVFLTGFVSLISRNVHWAKTCFLQATLLLCLFFNLIFGFEYWIGYSKQEAVVEALQNFDTQRLSNNYQVFDQAQSLNSQSLVWPLIWEKLIGVAFGADVALNAKIESRGKCFPNSVSNFIIIKGPRSHAVAVINFFKKGSFGFDVQIGAMNNFCSSEMIRIKEFDSWPVVFFFR